MAFKHGHFVPSAKPAAGIHGKPGSEKPPGAAMPKAPDGAPAAGEAIEHSSKHGSQPHPQTGVHSVHKMHMGGGKYMNHVHHEGGHVEKVPHNSKEEADQHEQEMLPSMAEHKEPDGDEFKGAMSAIGGESQEEEA